jgi:hypothetical protein
MSTQTENSHGPELIQAGYDIERDTVVFLDGADRYEWQSADLPFALIEGPHAKFAERALVRRYAHTALHTVKDVLTQEAFVPPWAEKTLGAQLNTELELEILRAFFEAWERLHAIPNKPENRKKSEAVAEALVEALVEAANAVRALRSPASVERIADGR